MTLIFVFDFCLECALTEAREAIVRALGGGRPNGGNVQLSEVQKKAEKAKNKAKNK